MLWALLLAALTPDLHAQTTYTWTGADVIDDLWTTPGNWSPAGVPGPADEAIIANGTVLAETNVTIGALTLGSEVGVNTEGTLGGTADVTVTGPLRWIGGGRFDGSGTVTVEGGSTIEPQLGPNTFNDMFLYGRTVQLGTAGSVAFGSGSSRLWFARGGVLEVDGPLSVSGPADGEWLLIHQSTLPGFGTIRTTGAGGISLSGGTLRVGQFLTYDNAGGGPLEATAGTLQIQTGTTTTSGVTAAAGATVTFSGGAYTVAGPVTAEGTVTFAGGTHSVAGDVTGTGTFSVAAGAVAVSGPSFTPTLTITGGTLTVASPLTLSQDLTLASGILNAAAPLTLVGALTLGSEVGVNTEGTLGGTADVTVTGPLRWIGGGRFDGSGTVTVEGGSTIEPQLGPNTFNDMFLYGRTVQLGTAGSVAFGSGSSRLWFARGGVLEVDGPLSVSGPADGEWLLIHQSTLPGFGTIRTTGAGGISLSGGTLRVGQFLTYDNAGGGPLEATAGTLQIQTGTTTTSGVTAAAGATVTFSGGAYTVAGPVTAEGTVTFAGGHPLGRGRRDRHGYLLSRGGGGGRGGPSFTPTLTITGGTLTVASPLTLSQDLTLASGILNAAAPLTLVGALTLGRRWGSTPRARSGARPTSGHRAAPVDRGGPLRRERDGHGRGREHHRAAARPQHLQRHVPLRTDGPTRDGGSVAFGSGSSRLWFARGGVLEVDGPLSVSGPADGEWLLIHQSTLPGFGTIRTTGAGGISLSGGTLRVSVALDNASALNIESDAALSLENTASNSGTLGGSGTLTIQNGTQFTNTGTVAPGTPEAAGLLSAGLTSGALSLAAPARLAVELGGPEPGTGYDRLDVAGEVALGGELAIGILGGYTPVAGQVFEVLTFTSRTGEFATYTGTSLGGGLGLEPSYTDASLVLTVVADANQPPVADDDFATTPEGVSVLIDVLDGDTDPDGDALSIAGVGVPANGTATTEAGQVRFTPTAGFTGTDGFTYTVTDGQGGTGQATVTVIVTAGGTTEYTVREINRVPQANLDALVALGAAVTTADVDNLLAYVHDGEEVQFTGVVLTDPYNSGLASWDPNTNRPVRTHVFVRDVAAVTDGYAGMTTQLVEEGLEGQVAEGRAYTVTGTVVVFEGVIQVIPTAFVDLGPYADLGLPDAIMEPVLAGTDDLSVPVTVGGEAKMVTNWAQFNDFNGQFVRFEGVEITASTGPGGRVPYQWRSPGTGALVNSDDISLRFRNDRAGGTYPSPPWNSRPVDDPFVAPPVGEAFDVQGFVTLRGFDFGADFIPPDRFFAVAPWDDEDLRPANQLPTANDDAAETMAGASVLIDVLGNDTDPDPGDALTIEDVGAPANGTASVEAGQVRYTPSGGFAGTDTFIYSVGDGRGGSAAASVTVTVSAIQVTAGTEGEAEAGSGVSVAVTVAGFTPTTAELRYRQGGASNFAAVPLTATGDGYRADIPPEAVGMRGVDYYVLLSDGAETVTVPAEAPEANPVHVPVRVTAQASGVPAAPDASYRMVTVPLVLDDPSPAAVFGDDFGPYVRSEWRLFRWTPGEDRYAEHPDLGAAMTPGVAVWLASHAEAPFDVDGGASVDASGPFALTLEPGWNQIGSPFAFAVAWDGVGGSDAVGAPVRRGNGDYEYDQPVLEPWEGYFVENATGAPVELAVFPVEAGTSRREGGGGPPRRPPRRGGGGVPAPAPSFRPCAAPP